MSLLKRLAGTLRFRKRREPSYPFALFFEKFQSILTSNNEVLEMMAAMGDKLSGDYVFDRHYIEDSSEQISHRILKMVNDLNAMADHRYVELYEAFDRIHDLIAADVAGHRRIQETRHTIDYEQLSRDLVEAVGGKNATLGDLRNILELKTPDGFAITTKAFQDFLEYNELHDWIEKQIPFCDPEDSAALEVISGEISRRILRGKLPPELRREIGERIEALKQLHPNSRLYFAVRSSAWAEDSEHSFAGQYKSLLNVPETELTAAFKQVVAGAYDVPALHYRMMHEFREHEMAMAVGCQLMIEPVSSGVLYTLDPAAPEREEVVVSGIWGLGNPLVAGETAADRYRVSRKPPHPTHKLHVVRKRQKLVPKEGGGTEWVPVPAEDQDKPCPGPARLAELVATGLLIERYFKRPQDIEWAFDQEGNLVILQARRLAIGPPSDDTGCDISEVMGTAPILFSGKGDVVQRGIAAGPVFVVSSNEDIKAFPVGAILVARQTSPRLAQLMRRAQGILTDIGSPTGHLATVAREFRIPTVVNTGVATQILNTGEEITLDATQNVVYQGTIKELCYYELTSEDVFEESYEYRLLSRIVKKISPLNLVDPHSPEFTPAGCRTYHDIARFVHEKAVVELIRLSGQYIHHRETVPRKLKLKIPLGLVIIDVDGGMHCAPNSKTVLPEEIGSVPMKAFLDGLCEPGIWDTQPISVDLGSFMSSVTRTFPAAMSGPEEVGRNLAVISRHYMNLNLRLGYHFNIIDAYVCDNVNDNLIYFRFLGGVTDLVRRSRRTQLISDILEHYDFRTEIRGDLVIGRAKKMSLEQMQKRMKLLGILVGYTRQLDVRLHSDNEVTEQFEAFMQTIPGLL